MTAPVIYPSSKSFLGLAKETTPGTAVAPTWTYPVDPSTGFVPEDKPVWLIDKSLRGSMAEEQGMQQGVVIVDWTMAAPMYADGVGFLLNNILGDLTSTGASAPYTHAFSLLNSGTAQPGTLTFTHWQGTVGTNAARTYAGACLSSLTIKGTPATDYLTVAAAGQAWQSADAAAAPTPNPTTATPLESWRAAIGVGGVASGASQVKTIGDWEVTITRAIKPIYTSQSAQTPLAIQRGVLTVAGKFTYAAAADESALTTMLNNTQPQLQILAANGGAGASLLSIQFDIQNGAYDTAKINMGTEAVGYDVTFKGIANSTNAGTSGGTSPIKVTLQNAVTTGTY